MFRGDVTYGQAGATRGFGGDRAYRGHTDSSERVRDIDTDRLRALEERTDSVGAGEQEPIEGAQIAERLIQRRKIRRRVKRNHGLEHGFGAASFQLANE